jgi:hypothetical protein
LIAFKTRASWISPLRKGLGGGLWRRRGSGTPVPLGSSAHVPSGSRKLDLGIRPKHTRSGCLILTPNDEFERQPWPCQIAEKIFSGARTCLHASRTLPCTPPRLRTANTREAGLGLAFTEVGRQATYLVGRLPEIRSFIGGGCRGLKTRPRP